MKLFFKGGKTDKLLVVDFGSKTYYFMSGIASGSIGLDTAKELNKLELKLVSEGFRGQETC